MRVEVLRTGLREWIVLEPSGSSSNLEHSGLLLNLRSEGNKRKESTFHNRIYQLLFLSSSSSSSLYLFFLSFSSLFLFLSSSFLSSLYFFFLSFSSLFLYFSFFLSSSFLSSSTTFPFFIPFHFLLLSISSLLLSLPFSSLHLSFQINSLHVEKGLEEAFLLRNSSSRTFLPSLNVLFLESHFLAFIIPKTSSVIFFLLILSSYSSYLPTHPVFLLIKSFVTNFFSYFLSFFSYFLFFCLFLLLSSLFSPFLFFPSFSPSFSDAKNFSCFSLFPFCLVFCSKYSVLF